MPAGPTAGANGKPATACSQVEKTGSARILNDDQALARVEFADRFVRVLGPILGSCRSRRHARPGGIKHIDIIIVGGMAERISPKQINTARTAAWGDGNPDSLGCETNLAWG